jgi:hypothetical protein
MVNNSTSINKTDNYLSSQNIEYKQTMTLLSLRTSMVHFTQYAWIQNMKISKQLYKTIGLN